MTLRDKLYFRFGLFHQRYGRIWCALLEGILIAISAFVIGLTVFGLANLAYMVYESALEEHARAYKAEARSYQVALINCLNGGVISKVGDEVIACDPAVTFRFSRVK